MRKFADIWSIGLALVATLGAIVVHVLQRLGYRPIQRTEQVVVEKMIRPAAAAREEIKKPWPFRSLLIVVVALVLVLASLLLIRPAACASEIEPSPTPRPTLGPTPSPRPTPSPSPTPTPEVIPTPTIPPVPTMYTVRPGDSLSGIAARFGVTVFDLQTWNSHGYPSIVSNPGFLEVGWTLVVALTPGVTPAPTPHVTPVPTTKPTAVPSVQPTAAPTHVPGQLAWPTSPRGYISCYFTTGHPALDIAVYCGAKVLAADAAVVTFEGWTTDGGGISVMLNLAGSNLQVRYAHMRATVVDRGQSVTRGQLLGYVDSTGNSTGCHVHFQITQSGRFVNPLPLIT